MDIKEENEEKEENKIEQQKMKKENSYHYWIKNDPNQKKIDCTPQKIEQTVAQKFIFMLGSKYFKDQKIVHQMVKANEMQQVPGKIHFFRSKQQINREEKKLSESQIKQCLEGLFNQEINIQNVVFSKCENISGEGVLIYVRQKKRLGYKLQFTLKFQYEGIEGSIKYTDLCDDGDREFEINFPNEKDKQTIRNSAAEVETLMIESLKQLK